MKTYLLTKKCVMVETTIVEAASVDQAIDLGHNGGLDWDPSYEDYTEGGFDESVIKVSEVDEDGNEIDPTEPPDDLENDLPVILKDDHQE